MNTTKFQPAVALDSFRVGAPNSIGRKYDLENNSQSYPLKIEWLLFVHQK